MADVTSLSILKGNSRELPHPIILHRYFEKELLNRSHDEYESNAVIFENKRIAYSELNALANKAARRLIKILRDMGVSPLNSEVFIAVDIPPCDWLIVVLLAILKCGAAYVPIDSQYAINRVRYILNEVNPLCILTHHESEFMSGSSTTWSRFQILDYEELFSVNDESEMDLKTSEMFVHNLTYESIACIIYTSGSTGMPKGVRLSHRVIMNRLFWQWQEIPFRENEVGCFKTSLLFVDSIVEIFSCILRLVNLTITPKSFITNPEKFVNFLEVHQVSRLVMVPSMLRNMLSYIALSGGSSRLPRLTTWICNSETLPPALLDKFFTLYHEDRIFYNFYGSTETMADVTFEMFCDKTDVSSKCFENHLSIGKPMYNSHVYLVDDNIRIVPRGEIGEICVSGLNVACGYMDNDRYPYFTDNVLDNSPFHETLYKTGDYGLIRNDRIIYKGRRDSQVKIRGQRVDISEIERAVQSHEGVDKAVVLCHKYKDTTNVVVAYYTTVPGVSVKMEAVRATCEASLPVYMVPKLMYLDEIPLQSHTGKVDRVTLKTLYQKSFKRQSSLELSLLDQKSRKALAILAINLDLPTNAVSQRASFFELGGNSVSMVSVIVQMREHGLHIPIESFSRAKTIKDIIDNVQVSSGDIKETLHTDRYLVKPLVDVTGSDEIIDILADSFIEKEPLDVLLGVTKAEIMIFSKSLYSLALQQSTSFLVIDKESGRIVGGDYLFDYFKGVDVRHHDSMAPLLTLLREFETPVKEKLQESTTGPLLFNFCLCVDKDLPHAEQVKICHLIEGNVLAVAKDKGFAGVVTNNTNPVTQHICEHYYDYKLLSKYLVRDFVFHNRKVFMHASEDYYIKMMIKYITASDHDDGGNGTVDGAL